MSVQTSYNFSSPIGIAGGIVDISSYSVESRINGQSESEAKLKFGMGVVVGRKAGTHVVIPAAVSTTEQFEGITVNGFTQQQDLEGKLHLNPAQSVGVMSWGKIWARIKPGTAPTYGAKAYLVKDGVFAGCFTDTSGADTIGVRARFIGAKGTGDIVQIELFNQKNS